MVIVSLSSLVSLPPIVCTREPPYEQLLVGVVADTVSFGSVVVPLSSSYEVASTREPPHEQWLTGMGGGCWVVPSLLWDAEVVRRRRGARVLVSIVVVCFDGLV